MSTPNCPRPSLDDLAARAAAHDADLTRLARAVEIQGRALERQSMRIAELGSEIRDLRRDIADVASLLAGLAEDIRLRP